MINNENEIWKVIENTDGKYEVSNKGNVKSYKTAKSGKKGELLKNSHDRQGYYVLNIKYPVVGFRRTFVHRLVLKTFIPNPENKKLVNHINGIKDDNNLENLEWCTSKENIRHAIDTGLRYKVCGSANQKLTKKQVLDIREKYSNGKCTQTSISKEYNVTISAICDIIKRRSWKHI